MLRYEQEPTSRSNDKTKEVDDKKINLCIANAVQAKIAASQRCARRRMRKWERYGVENEMPGAAIMSVPRLCGDVWKKHYAEIDFWKPSLGHRHGCCCCLRRARSQVCPSSFPIRFHPLITIPDDVVIYWNLARDFALAEDLLLARNVCKSDNLLLRADELATGYRMSVIFKKIHFEVDGNLFSWITWSHYLPTVIICDHNTQQMSILWKTIEGTIWRCVV